MALMMCVVNLGTLIFQRANNVLGEDVIAAHAASRKIIEAFMQPLGTLATANSTFVSQNWGAEKYGRIRAALLIPTYGYLGTSVTEPITWVIMTAFLAAAYLLRRKRMFPATERAESQLAGA